MANYYITHRPEGGWNIKREHADRASKIFENKNDAEQKAKLYSRNSGGDRSRDDAERKSFHQRRRSSR